MTDKQFKKGEVIFLEGDMGNTLYQIVDGAVTIYAGYGESEQQQLTELGKNKIFGEMSVIEACPRSTTAVAKEDVKVLEVNSDEVMDYFKTQPDRIFDIMKNLSARIRDLTADYAEAGNTVREIGNSVNADFGGALIELIVRFATEYQRYKALSHLSAEAERMLSHNEQDDGYAVKVQTYDKGTVIFKEGEKGDCMYDIRSGSVGIYEAYGTQEEKLLTQLYANQFFGELGMIDNVERSCTAVVMEDGTELELIFASDITELFEKNPEKIKLILEHLSFRLRKLTIDYMNACRMIYRVNAARNAGGVDDGLKAEAKSFTDELVVISSLKL